MYVCYVTYYVTGMAKRTKQQISTNQMGLLQNKIHTLLMDGALDILRGEEVKYPGSLGRRGVLTFENLFVFLCF